MSSLPIGEHAPHFLARTVTCTSGRVVATMSVRPRSPPRRLTRPRPR